MIFKIKRLILLKKKRLIRESFSKERRMSATCSRLHHEILTQMKRHLLLSQKLHTDHRKRGAFDVIAQVWLSKQRRSSERESHVRNVSTLQRCASLCWSFLGSGLCFLEDQAFIFAKMIRRFSFKARTLEPYPTQLQQRAGVVLIWGKKLLGLTKKATLLVCALALHLGSRSAI
mgnify:CR=1 FL=1